MLTVIDGLIPKSHVSGTPAGGAVIVLVGYAEVLGGQRLRPCRAAATSIRTKSSSLTGPPIF